MVPHVVPHFRLLTLGAPLLFAATNEAVRYRTRKHFALLIRLALEPGKKFARDYLIELLWPDVTAERGRHSLSQAITVMRQTVGRQHLAIQRSSIALAEGVVETDALRLETDEPEIRGRFLEGFELRGARGFDEWREGWAARLHRRVRDCLVKRMDAARRIGDFATVERHARVLEDIDPVSEDAVRGIMEARAWVGDRSSALKAFTRFAARLAEDLNAKPGAELERIADLMRAGRRAAPRPTADGVAPPREERRFEAESIIGRQREFATLYDAWAAVRRCRPQVAVLLGEPGIGKTTLTNAFLSSCQMEAGIIARAQAYDAERELPYAVLAELVRHLTLQRAIGAAEPEALAELSRLTPEIVSVFPGVPRPAEWAPEIVPLRLADAFFKAVSAASEEYPVVLVVDDIHAADNASVAILHMLARKLAGLRVLVIVTGRPGSLRGPSSAYALVTDAMIEGLSTLDLEPLSKEAAAVLAARASVKGVERWGEAPIEDIVRLGGGNSLALELLCREWVESGPDSLVGTLDPLHPLPGGLQSIPKAIRTVVERQTAELAERTRAVFDLASVLGRRMGDLWLYQVIGCTEAEALYELGQLLEARLLRDIAGALEFRNELIRAHAYYEVPSAVRLELHRRIASMLEGQRDSGGGQADLEIAWHLILGRDLRRAVPYATAGAEQSLQTGAAKEAEHILRHLTRVEIDPERDRQVLLVLSAALISQSRAEDALPYLERILSDTRVSKPEMAQAAHLFASAMYLLNRDSSARQSEMAERAVLVARECDDKNLLAHALFESARASVESGNAILAKKVREELRTALTEWRDDAPPIAYHANAYCSYYLSDMREACESAGLAVARLTRNGTLGETAMALTGQGNCMTALCRFEEARSAYNLGLEYAHRCGDDYRTSSLMCNLAALHLLKGETDASIALGQESLAIGKRASAQPTLLKTWSNLVSAHVIRGELESAKRHLGAWQEWIQNGRSWAARMEYCCSLACIELVLGNTTEALRLTEAIEREDEGIDGLVLNQGVWQRLRVFFAYHTNGPDSARDLAMKFMNRFRDNNVLAYLDALAAFAWTERKSNGGYSERVTTELQLFDAYGLQGKREILIAEGYLERSK